MAVCLSVYVDCNPFWGFFVEVNFPPFPLSKMATDEYKVVIMGPGGTGMNVLPMNVTLSFCYYYDSYSSSYYYYYSYAALSHDTFIGGKI